MNKRRKDTDRNTVDKDKHTNELKKLQRTDIGW